MKHIYLLTLLVVFATSFSVTAQQQYTNGNLATGTINNAGVTAPAGYVWSELQNDVSDPTFTNIQTGFSIGNPTYKWKLADDFVVPAGEIWQINNFEFYTFDITETTNEMLITDLRIEIYNGSPALASSTKIYGDLVTNTLDLANSGEAYMYQIKNSNFPQLLFSFPDSGYKIFKLRGNVNLTLPAGTYYVLFQFVHPTSAGVFVPLNKYIGSRGYPQGAPAQYLNTNPGGSWLSIYDPGGPAGAPDIPQDFPFHINYSLTLSTGESTRRKASLHPNPANDLLTVSIPEGHWNSPSFEIINLQGATVSNSKASEINNGEFYTLDVSRIATGVYILKIVDGSEVYTSKFVKK